jgi:predicted ribosome quality control (RQC) complex YloA/Tae2 family protein
LSGLRIDRVQSRQGDRLIAFDCSARSRFGVANGYRLVAELVPRYGNLILLKDRTVVSAAREFHAGGRTLRTVAAGEEYEPPPLPAVPRLVAGATLEPDVTDDAFAYRDDAGRIVAAHVVRLAQHAALREERVPALLPVLTEALQGERAQRGDDALSARRSALLAKLERRRAALAAERAQLEREADDEAGRERLRRSGDALYAHSGQIPAGAARFEAPGAPGEAGLSIELDPDLDAKANAREFFRRYKKSVARGKHAARRAADIAREAAGLDELAWEAERADAAALAEIADELDRLERPKAERRPRLAVRRPLEFALASDARVLVGRSPRGNADLTFRVARPGDLWFHARATPGAHVVLHLDSTRPLRDEELTAAAQLAAYHSKARESEKVAVDYTERKYVRRQAGGAPGRVWYTNARTLVVTPKDGAVS